MSSIDVAELRAEMEAEREWREAEMRFFRNQVAQLGDENQRATARKALVVMLYAHFEGLCKAILGMYVSRLNALGIPVSEAAPALGAASLDDVFRALRHPDSKCKEFARSLPDDSALHRFARDREFVAVAWRIGQRPVRIETEKLVDTEGNLKPAVLRKILYRLGLDPKMADPWEGTMQMLLRRRNDVAHGTARAGRDGGIEAEDYQQLEDAVRKTIDGLVVAVYGAAASEAYRVAA